MAILVGHPMSRRTSPTRRHATFRAGPSGLRREEARPTHPGHGVVVAFQGGAPVAGVDSRAAVVRIPVAWTPYFAVVQTSGTSRWIALADPERHFFTVVAPQHVSA